jgi:hypothetical protein
MLRNVQAAVEPVDRCPGSVVPSRTRHVANRGPRRVTRKRRASVPGAVGCGRGSGGLVVFPPHLLYATACGLSDAELERTWDILARTGSDATASDEEEESDEEGDDDGPAEDRSLRRDLTARFGRGFSRPGLQRMRAFYQGWDICSTPSSKFEARVRLPEGQLYRG